MKNDPRSCERNLRKSPDFFFFFFSSFGRYFENELIKKLNAKRFLKYILKTF